jgi:hypothetical protein
LPDVRPNVAAAELGSGAPAGEPAQQGVGEVEAEAGEAAEPAVPPFFIGGDSPSDREESEEEAEAGEAAEPAVPPFFVGGDSPSDREESEEVCCFCPSSAFSSLVLNLFLILGRRLGE